MSKSSRSDLGLGLLWLPGGLLIILAIVAGLFLSAHDTPSPRHLSSANYHASAE